MRLKKHIIINSGRLLLAAGALPESPLAKPVTHVFAFGPYEAYGAEENAIEGAEWVELRRSWLALPHEDYFAAAKGAELLHWEASCRWCAHCGAELHRASEISKKCPECGREYFPQVAPCIIVLVRRGDEALLVRGANFRHKFHGLVAGFVETGESLEECVGREVKEETNLDIDNISYFGSQTWPFPSQLMIAFTADYAGVELRFADGELAEGGFFTRENHPEIPSPPSIGRELIDFWLHP